MLAIHREHVFSSLLAVDLLPNALQVSPRQNIHLKAHFAASNTCRLYFVSIGWNYFALLDMDGGHCTRELLRGKNRLIGVVQVPFKRHGVSADRRRAKATATTRLMPSTSSVRFSIVAIADETRSARESSALQCRPSMSGCNLWGLASILRLALGGRRR